SALKIQHVFNVFQFVMRPTYRLCAKKTTATNQFAKSPLRGAAPVTVTPQNSGDKTPLRKVASLGKLLFDSKQIVPLGQRLVIRIERITAAHQAVSWGGRAIAECPAEPLALDRAAGERVGRQFGIGQDHPSDSDEIDPTGAHGRLGDMGQVILEIAVA